MLAAAKDASSGEGVSWFENDGSESYAEHVVVDSANAVRCAIAVDAEGRAERLPSTGVETLRNVFPRRASRRCTQVDADGDVDDDDHDNDGDDLQRQ